MAALFTVANVCKPGGHQLVNGNSLSYVEHEMPLSGKAWKNDLLLTQPPKHSNTSILLNWDQANHFQALSVGLEIKSVVALGKG